ncbi:hypothetical protein FRC15_004901, partial [Serendipita sp. 397]
MAWLSDALAITPIDCSAQLKTEDQMTLGHQRLLAACSDENIQKELGYASTAAEYD